MLSIEGQMTMAKTASDLNQIDRHDQATDGPVDSMRERVEQVLNLIRPAVQSDGGDVELVDVSPDGVVQVRLHGACVGCPSSTMTLQTGIERNLKLRVPGVSAVQAVV
jgi:Fe-S cluster biogenesis protein NfuA